jgi:hypothetical protein
MVHNVWVASRKRDPEGNGAPLTQVLEESWKPRRGPDMSTMDILKEGEETIPGLGILLVKIFFPGNLNDEEDRYWKDRRTKLSDRQEKLKTNLLTIAGGQVTLEVPPVNGGSAERSDNDSNKEKSLIGPMNRNESPSTSPSAPSIDQSQVAPVATTSSTKSKDDAISSQDIIPAHSQPPIRPVRSKNELELSRVASPAGQQGVATGVSAHVTWPIQRKGTFSNPSSSI